MAASEPAREEVLAWLGGSPYRTAEDAADHFWPGFADRPKLLGRIRQWVSRAKRASTPAAENRDDATDPGDDDPPRPPVDYALVDLDVVPFLRWQLGELIADLAWARARGDLRLAAPLDTRVSEVALQLRQARTDAGSTLDLDESPEKIATEVAKRQKQINELMAARARRERDL